MTHDHQLLERLRAVVSGADRAAGDAVDPETVWAAARGELDREETVGLAEQALADPETAEAWRLAVELAPPSAQVVALAPHRWRRVVLAAAAVVVIGLLVPLLLDRPGGWRLRGGDGPVTSALADGCALPRSDFVVRWTPGPRGSTYQVWVGDADLATLFEATGLTATEVQVPASRLAGLAPGERVLWTVTSIDRLGRRSASATFVVVVASPDG